MACKNKVNGMIAQRVSGHEDLIAAHDIVRALDWPTMKPFLQEFNVTAFGVKVIIWNISGGRGGCKGYRCLNPPPPHPHVAI